MEAVAAGDAEIIDAPEIPPELIADWIEVQTHFYNIPMLALDDYRFALMKAALARVGFTYENKNIKLVRQPTFAPLFVSTPAAAKSFIFV